MGRSVARLAVQPKPATTEPGARCRARSNAEIYVGIGSLILSSVGWYALAASFQPSLAAAAHAVEVVPAHELAVAVEVHANLIAGAASRTACAVIREWRERGDVDCARLHGVSGATAPRGGRAA